MTVIHRDRARNHKTCVHRYEKGEPSGYSAWHEWAEKHLKTHTHSPCPDCGLYVVCARAVPRTEGAAVRLPQTEEKP